MDKIDEFAQVKSELATGYKDLRHKITFEPVGTAPNTPLIFTPWDGLLPTEMSPTGSPGDWTLTAWLDSGDGTHQCLDADAIENIIIGCYLYI